jgi:glutathione S-transferase
MLTITNFPRGARGVRVAWLCEELGLAYQIRLVPYPVPADYRAANPLGTVPFLQDGDIAMSESVAMLLHIAGAHGPTPLLPPPGGPQYARVLQMMLLSEATLGAFVNALIVDRFAVPEGERGGALPRLLLSRIEQGLGYLDQVLSDAPYLAGDGFTLADIAVCTTLGIWRGALKGALSEVLSNYHARATSRPAYARAAKANAGS